MQKNENIRRKYKEYKKILRSTHWKTHTAHSSFLKSRNMQNPSFEREITRGLPIKRERLLDSFLFIYLFFFFLASIRAKYNRERIARRRKFSRNVCNRTFNKPQSVSQIWLTSPGGHFPPSIVYPSAWLDVEIHRGQLTIPNCPPLSAPVQLS